MPSIVSAHVACGCALFAFHVLLHALHCVDGGHTAHWHRGDGGVPFSAT